jgi:tripartite-type tricarboxylate transporter receptor subunit TctC
MSFFRSCVAVVLAASVLASCSPAASSGSAPGRAEARGGAGGPAAARPPADNYFAGKTLTILVNLSAGGPTDVFARMIAQYLARHVPGNPGIVVENKTGAGGTIGLNHLYAVSRKDGLTLGVVSAPFDNQLFSDQAIEYDASKFYWVGSVGESEVGFAHRDLGVKTPAELISTPNEVVLGGLKRESVKDLYDRTFLDLLGVKYRYVTGYPGNADARLAMQRGEINFYSESLTGWFTAMTPLAKDGTIYPLGQTGLIKGGQIVRDPRVGDIPTYPELAAELRGERIKNTVAYRAALPLAQSLSMLRAILYPPGTPPEIGEVMRQAMAETFADPEFVATSEKQVGFAMELTPGAEAEVLARQIIDGADRETIEHLKGMARE